MTLDIKKIYVDSRFRTSDSVSASDFSIEIPRTFNIPEDVVCFIDDIVLPVSWSTIDARNDTCYLHAYQNGTDYWFSCKLAHTNYDGPQFKTELETKLTAAIPVGLSIAFDIEYELRTNLLKIKFNDTRVSPMLPTLLNIFSDKALELGLWNNTRISGAPSINGFIRNDTGINLISSEPGQESKTVEKYLDLVGIRNLYLTSSSLSSYDHVSNFSLDTVIKKIAVTVNYNEMITHTGGNSIDYLNVSKRSLRYIDFKLVDSYGRTVDMQENHFSFSIIFEHKR